MATVVTSLSLSTMNSSDTFIPRVVGFSVNYSLNRFTALPREQTHWQPGV